jgi:hypothetical protein
MAGNIQEVTERLVDDFTSRAMMFTALDISNAVKQQLPGVRHREVAPLVRDMFERKGMGAYIQTMIDVMAGGSTPARAYLYHLPEQPTSLYDDTMRNQLATRPQQAMKIEEDKPIAQGVTSAPVRVGGDGRGRVSRQLLESAGITGDRVLVKSDAAIPRLQILPGGSTAPTPLDPLFAVPDLFFTATDAGQPLNFEHPSLLHVPRSMMEIFGTDPKLVAKIDGASVVVVKE